jgi:hypothetical protein
MSERQRVNHGLSALVPHGGCEQSGPRSFAGRPGPFAERSEVPA